jgi:hypothetical protein
MKMKILFVVLVMVLLSSTVVAKEKEKVSHKDRENQRVEHMHNHEIHEQNIATQEFLQKMYTEAASVSGGALKKDFERQATEAGEKLKKEKEASAREKAAAESVYPGETLFSKERGLYSFYDYLDAYDAYSGINVYSSLFFEEDWLAKRREMAADYFCEKTLLLGGKECWKSKICESYYYTHDPPAGRNILVAQPTVAGYMPAASIQGEKSLPMSYKEGSKTKTGHIYKITYSITNPHRGVLTYHIKLIGDSNTFESPPMTVSNSNPPESYQRVDRLGNDPLITESGNDYHTVCLAFTPRIRTIHAKRVSEICSPIIQYEGAATKPYTSVPEVEGDDGAAGPQAPTDPLSGA